MTPQLSKKAAVRHSLYGDIVVQPCKSTLFSVLCSAFINKKHQAIFFFPVEEAKFVENVAWVCEAYQYSEKQGAEGKEDGFIHARALPTYQYGLRAAFVVKKPLKYSIVDSTFQNGFGLSRGFTECFLHLRTERPWKLSRTGSYETSSSKEVMKDGTKESKTLGKLSINRRASCSWDIWRATTIEFGRQRLKQL